MSKYELFRDTLRSTHLQKSKHDHLRARQKVSLNTEKETRTQDPQPSACLQPLKDASERQKQELKEPKRTQPVTGQTALKEVTKETAEGVASEVAVSETSPEIVTPKQEPTEEQANPTTALSDAANAVAASIPVAVSTPAFLEPPQAPHYPRSMRSRGLGGVVIVEVLIGAKGNQTELEIAKSSGLPALDQSALSAVRKWRFKPHAVNGINVASRVHIPVRFAIN